MKTAVRSVSVNKIKTILVSVSHFIIKTEAVSVPKLNIKTKIYECIIMINISEQCECDKGDK